MIYRMRKIVSHSDDVPLPTCMYQLKNINYEDEKSSESASEPEMSIKEQVIKFLKIPNKTMAELEKRQDSLLHQLDMLYDRIMSLSSLCTSVPATSHAQHNTKKQQQIAAPADVIINASAHYLPYFLVILTKGPLKNKINVSYHIHSTVPTTSVNKIKEFVKLLNLEQLCGPVQVKLIFKEVSVNTELKWSLSGVPIVGEVNILRYLSLLFPEAIPYEETLEEDSLLDECYLLQRSSLGESDGCLQRLFSSYGGDWILGKQYSIVDIAAISVIKQIEPNTPKLFRFTPKVWFDKANQLLK